MEKEQNSCSMDHRANQDNPEKNPVPSVKGFNGISSLAEYIEKYQVDGILWKADKLLPSALGNPMELDKQVTSIARTISLMPKSRQVAKDAYISTISKKYGLSRKTFEKLVSDQSSIEEKKK